MDDLFNILTLIGLVTLSSSLTIAIFIATLYILSLD